MKAGRKVPRPIVYEQRVLAYIDILAWKDLIKRSADDFSVMATITKAVESLTEHRRFVDHVGRSALGPQSIQLTVFSDTVVLSCRPNPRAVYFLCMHAKKFCIRLMEAGLYTRGAIVRGALYHSGDIIFGPALVEAYTLESSVAKYPRIVVANSIRSGPLAAPGNDDGHLPDVLLTEGGRGHAPDPESIRRVPV